MDIGADRALIGGAGGLLGGRSHAALAQHDERLLHVAIGFLEGLEAVAHGRAGLFAEFLDELCVDLGGGGGHWYLSPSRHAEVRRVVQISSTLIFASSKLNRVFMLASRDVNRALICVRV